MDKIIREMAKTYCKNGFECGNPCQTNGCRVYEVCTELYNAGYRKIPENAVVLTREEYEWLTCCFGKFEEIMNDIKELTRKETAGKFAERLKGLFYEYGKYTGYYINEIIDEICKEFTEG